MRTNRARAALTWTIRIRLHSRAIWTIPAVRKRLHYPMSELGMTNSEKK